MHSSRLFDSCDPRYRPLRELRRRVATALPNRPILIAETGAEAGLRAPWLRYVGGEVRAALRAGVPVEGLGLYPVVDCPGWTNERHCPVRRFGDPGADGSRPLCAELAARQRLFTETLAVCQAEPRAAGTGVALADHASCR